MARLDAAPPPGQRNLMEAPHDPFADKIVEQANTFDDVLLLPQRSDFTPADAMSAPA